MGLIRTNSRIVGVVVLLLLLLSIQPSQPAAARSWLRWAYYVPDDPRSYASLAAHHRFLDVVAPDTWRVHPDGTITSNTPLASLRTMEQWGVQVMPMVQKYTWADHMHPFWVNPATRVRAATQLAALVAQGAYPGIHLDLENIDRADGPALQAFVYDVAARIHDQGRLMTLTLPAKALGEYDWYPEYNYQALARVADLVVIMAYDHGYALGSPAPVAPLAWFDAVIRYTRQQLPANKIIIGMPWYGYDWNTATHAPAVYVSSQQAQDWGRIFSYDRQAQAPVTQYWYNGSHTIWYENAVSIAVKLRTITHYDLRGWAAWRLGYEDPAIWNTLTPHRTQ